MSQGGNYLTNGGGGAGSVMTETGDFGGAIPPDGSGNLNILGTANQVTSTGVSAANTITLSTPSTFIAPGSITSTGLLTGLASALINTAGTALNLGTDNSGDTINIGLGNVARTLHIADSAIAHTITMGSQTGTGTTFIQSGSGGIAIRSTGNSVFNTSTGTLGLSTDASNTTISIGNAAASKSITIGTTFGSSSLALQSGSLGILTTGTVSNLTNPCFLAYLATTATNKTGNGTFYVLGTNAFTVAFDKGNNIGTNAILTAPITGVYELSVQVQVTGTTIATSFNLQIQTTLRTYSTTINRAAASTDQCIFLTALCDMNVGNVAQFVITSSGEGADTDDILGGSTLTTYVCGKLVA